MKQLFWEKLSVIAHRQLNALSTYKKFDIHIKHCATILFANCENVVLRKSQSKTREPSKQWIHHQFELLCLITDTNYHSNINKLRRSPKITLFMHVGETGAGRDTKVFFQIFSCIFKDMKTKSYSFETLLNFLQYDVNTNTKLTKFIWQSKVKNMKNFGAGRDMTGQVETYHGAG